MRALLVACAIVTSCAEASVHRSDHTGSGMRASRAINKVPTRGFDITVKTWGNDIYKGELLAAEREVIWLLVDGQIVPVSVGTISDIGLELDDSTATGVFVMTGIGGVSTLSHGMMLMFSLPIWAATGVPLGVYHAYRNNIRNPERNLAFLFQYARFPSGLPDNLRK